MWISRSFRPSNLGAGDLGLQENVISTNACDRQTEQPKDDPAPAPALWLPDASRGPLVSPDDAEDDEAEAFWESHRDFSRWAPPYLSCGQCFSSGRPVLFLESGLDRPILPRLSARCLDIQHAAHVLSALSPYEARSALIRRAERHELVGRGLVS